MPVLSLQDVFLQDSSQVEFKTLGEVYWPFGQWPVPNRPKCGYGVPHACVMSGSLGTSINALRFGRPSPGLLVLQQQTCRFWDFRPDFSTDHL